MKLLPAFLQARLESFTIKSKSRRTSARSKKTTTTTSSWPLASPLPYDLAYAGFVWEPTSASPDNVQCFLCHCQLDGWEPSDTPAYEHLTHSPNCGIAINICIRMRNSDPDRAEEDPLSDKMKDARRVTFGDFWPLDSEAGFPSIDQLVEAGFYYDPSPESVDGVTCPYCSLSLDGWDKGDDPLQEHRGRNGDSCLFFALKELYHPASIPFTRTSIQQKTAPAKGKRTSSRSSTTKKAAPKAATKAPAKTTRGRKAATSDVEPETHHNKPLPAIPIEFSPAAVERAPIKAVPAKPTSAKAPTKAPAKAPAKTRKVSKRTSTTSTLSTTTRQTRGAKLQDDDVEIPDAEIPPPSTASSFRQTRGTKRASEASTASNFTRPTRGTKRTSDAIDIAHDNESETRGSKRTKRISNSDALDKLDWPSSLPESALAGTPSFPASSFQRTPERDVPKAWDPVDIDDFFNKENLPVLAQQLSTDEKQMTVQQWLMYEAKRQEDSLREQCFAQIEAYEAQARRALAAIDAL